MIRASMIDGFGAFKRADYRRSWLFFDQVDYLIPEKTLGPLVYPQQLYDAPQYEVVHGSFDPGELEFLIAWSREQADRPEFRALVQARVPQSELEYARGVVLYDATLLDQVPDRRQEDPVFALAFLANKLWLHAQKTQTLPIFGRGYAQAILSARLGPAVVLEKRRYATFAAGLSLGFVNDATLSQVPLEELVAFKENNRTLLERHQKHLLKVAQSFRALPAGPEFEDHLARLRLQMEAEREALETDARLAWQNLHRDVLRHAMVASATTFLSGLAVVQPHSATDLLTAGVPAALAGLSAAAAASLDSLSKRHRAETHGLAYLFEAAQLTKS